MTAFCVEWLNPRGPVGVRSPATVLTRPRILRNLSAVFLAGLLSGCRSPLAPIGECQTGELDLVNLSDNLAPRDVYVDNLFVATLPSGANVVVTQTAGLVHSVEWVSTISGNTLDVTRVLVDGCTTTTLTNHF